MCRSIKTLRPVGDRQQPASEEEIAAAALQYVRKVSGYRRPSRANAAAFAAAVDEVSRSTSRLLASLGAAGAAGRGAGTAGSGS
ncbi:MAG: DUF2277 family protein [Chloroflexi bacterium]|nr:DUF2277 family protein [Chloroflexota bacterium]